MITINQDVLPIVYNKKHIFYGVLTIACNKIHIS